MSGAHLFTVLPQVHAGGTVSPDGSSSSTITFRDMYAEEVRETLVVVSLPQATDSQQQHQQQAVAEVELEYVDVSTGTVERCVQQLLVCRSPSGSGTSAPHPLVITTAARYKTAEVRRGLCTCCNQRCQSLHTIQWAVSRQASSACSQSYHALERSAHLLLPPCLLALQVIDQAKKLTDQGQDAAARQVLEQYSQQLSQLKQDTKDAGAAEQLGVYMSQMKVVAKSCVAKVRGAVYIYVCVCVCCIVVPYIAIQYGTCTCMMPLVHMHSHCSFIALVGVSLD